MQAQVSITERRVQGKIACRAGHLCGTRMRKRTATTFIALLGILGVLSGCANKGTAAATEAPQTAETTADAVKVREGPTVTPDEEMLSKYFVGIMDRFVLEGAKDIDYLSETDGMEQVVERIEADDREVDMTRPGTYTVRYKVTVNVKNLERAEAYIREHPDAVHINSDLAKTQEKKEETVAGTTGASGETNGQAVTEEAADSQEIPEVDRGDEQGQDTAKEAQEHGQSSQEASAGTTGEEGDAAPEEPEDEKTIQEVLPEIPESVFEGQGNDTAPEETAEVIVEKEVTIVTPEEAEEIIRGGGEVWTDGSKPVRIEDLEKPEDAVTGDTAAAEKPAASERKEDTPEETGGSDHSAGDDGGREEEHQESVHTHDWVEQTKTVHHDETGHYEDVQSGTRTVVDEEAWDEPVYETKAVCNACGYEADSTSEINDHLDTHYDPELGYSDASYSTKRVQVDTIHHSAKTHEEPVYEQEWVVDSEAWDEEVVTGYRCRTCGAEK